LNLASSVTSADIVDNTIVNADINTAAAIAYSKLNLASSITSADIVDSTIVIGDLAAALQAFLVPTGTVSAFAGSSAPTGYLLCDGAAVSRSTYSALFGVVSTTYGVGDGSTTFNTPNLKCRTVIGVGVGTEITGVLGTVQGVKEVMLTAAESGTTAHDHPSGTSGASGVHSHTYSGTTSGSDWNAYYNHYSALGGSGPVPVSTSEGAGRTYQGAGGNHTHTFSGTTIDSSSHTHTYTITAATAAAAASAHTNIQPSLPLNYIIKV
jgi:microcystin-dependent protein